jgi:ClpP class serine protease
VTLSSIGQAEKISYYDIHRSIRFAATDDKIPGIVVRIGRSMTMSWAQMSEFRSSLQQFKELAPEKEIVCFCESFDHIGTLFLSSLGDRVVMQPAGIVNLQGIAGGSLFFSNALERAGVKAQVEKRHEYKNALDFLTNEKYDDAQREVTENLINGINDYVRKTIAKERGLDESTLDQLQSQGTVSSFEAMKLGIIDETAYLQDYVLESSGTLGATEQYLEDQNSEDAEKDNEADQLREDAALESTFGKILSNELEHSSSSSRKVPKYPPRQKGSGMMSVKTRPVWDVKNYLKKFDVYLKSEEKSKKAGYVAIIHAEVRGVLELLL